MTVANAKFMETLERADRLRKAVHKLLERAAPQDTDPLTLLDTEDALRATPDTD